MSIHMFSWRNKKKIFLGYTLFSGAVLVPTCRLGQVTVFEHKYIFTFLNINVYLVFSSLWYGMLVKLIHFNP